MSISPLIDPARLAELEAATIDSGAHDAFEDGACSMEWVAYLANLGHTDAPSCASLVIARYVIRLNDRWSTERRQSLKPYLPRLVGTGGDGKDPARERIAATWLADRLLPEWLALAGMTKQSEALAAVKDADTATLTRVLREIREAAWALRQAKRDELAAKIRAELEKRGKPVAVAAAAADAAVDAAAAVDAVAAADAAAVAVAAVDAFTDAAVDAAAVAAAVAVAVAVAVADAAAAVDWPTSYSAAYRAARDYYRTNPLPVMAQVEEIAARQSSAALELLEALIDPEVSA